MMRFLLTSAGIKNMTIRNALVELLGKPIADSSALCIPTAAYAMPGGAGMAWRLITGRAVTPLCGSGWKSMGVLELTALPSLAEDLWMPAVRQADALLVGGGDALYLVHWMRRSGLADLLPSLREAVYVGVSGGSMAVGRHVGETFVGWAPPAGGDEGLGLVDFSLFPHLDHDQLPANSMAHAERWAAALSGPAYAIDDETAIRVADDAVEVVSEGRWRLFVP